MQGCFREEKQSPTYYWEGECEDQPSSQHSQQQRQNSQSEPFLSHKGGQHGGATVLILPRRLLLKHSCVSISISIAAPTGICLELNTTKRRFSFGSRRCLGFDCCQGDTSASSSGDSRKAGGCLMLKRRRAAEG